MSHLFRNYESTYAMVALDGLRCCRRSAKSLYVMTASLGPRVAWTVFVASFLFALVAFYFDGPLIGTILASPALLLSGWAFMGHLVTLDDDMPGEWSNPEGSRSIWYRSVAELLTKSVLFGILVIGVLSQW